ncbi:MAG: cyclic nucleotide-binding domain-containing protein [Pseudomonadota bacterium]
MTAEERALIAEVLAIEEPAKQRRLREVITWRDADTGEVLMRQGQKAPPLIYVATGQMEIEHEGLPVSSCGPDDFLGEMSLVTGEGASATVKVSLPARIAVFDRAGLLRLMDAMPELARAFDHRLNIGLVDKIQRMNRAMNTTGAGR